MHKHGRGVVLDFTRIGREVRAAVGLLATQKRDSDFFGSRKCENKWRELLNMEDAKKGGNATRGQRKAGDPTAADRAAEMLERLREERKAEIQEHLVKVKAQIVETDKELAAVSEQPQSILDRMAKEATTHPDLHLMDPKSVLGRAGSIPLPSSSNSNSKTEAAAASSQAPKPMASAAGGAAAPAAAPAPTPVKDERSAQASQKTPAQPPAAAPAAAPAATSQKAATPLPAPAAVPVAASTPVAAATPSAAPSVSRESSVAEDLPIAVIKKRNEQFAKVWKQMNSHEKAEPFKKPVTKREAPDYHTVIKKPMALNDVKKRVDKNDYEGNAKEFFSDMNLIFSNAMQYNTKNSDIWSWAKELQSILKKEEQDLALAGSSAAAEPAAPEAAPAPAPKAGRGGATKKGSDTPDVVEEPKAKRARGRVEEEEEEEAAEPETKARSRRQSAGQSTRKRRREND